MHSPNIKCSSKSGTGPPPNRKFQSVPLCQRYHTLLGLCFLRIFGWWWWGALPQLWCGSLSIYNHYFKFGVEEWSLGLQHPSIYSSNPVHGLATPDGVSAQLGILVVRVIPVKFTVLVLENWDLEMVLTLHYMASINTLQLTVGLCQCQQQLLLLLCRTDPNLTLRPKKYCSVGPGWLWWETRSGQTLQQNLLVNAPGDNLQLYTRYKTSDPPIPIMSMYIQFVFWLAPP